MISIQRRIYEELSAMELFCKSNKRPMHSNCFLLGAAVETGNILVILSLFS